MNNYPEHPMQWLDIGRLRECGAKPHYFGLGFIQLKVSRDTRVHFWVPHWRSIPGAESELHNHRYDFSSMVLKGSLEQRVYSLGEVQAAPWNSDCLEVIDVGCSVSEASDPVVIGYANPTLLVSHSVQAGQRYTLSHHAFHIATPKDNAISVVNRGTVSLPFARVARPLGGSFSCPFALGYTEEECWEHIQAIL